MLLGKKRHKLLLIAALTSLGAMAWVLWPQASAESIVRRGVACLEAQDASCLYKMAESGEMQAYGLTEKSFERLMRQYVFQGPWVKEGAATVRPGPIRGGYQGQVYFVQGDTSLGLGILAANTGEKNELVSLVTSLILSRMPPVNSQDRPGSRMLKWIARDSATLTGLGVLGINRSDGFLTWGELETRYRNMPSASKQENKSQ